MILNTTLLLILKEHGKYNEVKDKTGNNQSWIYFFLGNKM